MADSYVVVGDPGPTASRYLVILDIDVFIEHLSPTNQDTFAILITYDILHDVPMNGDAG